MKQQKTKTKGNTKDYNIYMFNELNRLSYEEKEYNLLPLISGALGCLYYRNSLHSSFREFTKKFLEKIYYKEIKSHFAYKNIRNINENDLYTYFNETPKFDKFYSDYSTNFKRTLYFFDSIQLLSVVSMPSNRIGCVSQIQCLLDSVCLYFDKSNQNEIDNSFVIKNAYIPVIYGFINSYNNETKKEIITESGKDFFEFVFSLITFMSKVEHGNVCEQEFFIEFFNKYKNILNEYFLVDETYSYFTQKRKEIISEIPFKYFKANDPFYTEENPYFPIFYINDGFIDISMEYLFFILYEIWIGVCIDINKTQTEEREQMLNKKNNELKVELKNSRKEVLALISEKKETPIKIESLEKKVFGLRNEIDINKNHYKEEIKSYEEDYKTLNNKYEKLKNRNIVLEEKIKELNSLLMEAKQYIPNINEENESLVEAIEISNQEQELPIEFIIDKIKNHRFLFLHGIQGYEKHLNKYFNKVHEVNINEKVAANFIIPQDIDAVIALTKTVPHSHIEHANKYKAEGIPTILTSNKNIELVLRDIYKFLYG